MVVTRAIRRAGASADARTVRGRGTTTKLVAMGRVRRQLMAVACLSLGLIAAVIGLGALAISLLGYVPPLPGAGAHSSDGVLVVSTPAPSSVQTSQSFPGPRPIFVTRPAAPPIVPTLSPRRARPQPIHRADAREARRRPERERRQRNTHSKPAPASAPAVMASADAAATAALPASRRRGAARQPIRPAAPAQKSRPRSLTRARQAPAPARQVKDHGRPLDHAPSGAAQGHRPRPAHPGTRTPKPIAQPDLPTPPSAQPGRGHGPASGGPPAQQPNGHAGRGHGNGH